MRKRKTPPSRPPDLTLYGDNCPVCFWWKEMVQTNDANIDVVYYISVVDGALCWHGGMQAIPRPYEDLQWFRTNKKAVMESYASYILEQELLK